MNEYLVVFSSTHAALAFESSFGEGGGLIPVPSSVRAGCGMGLRFFEKDHHAAWEKTRQVAECANVANCIEGVYVRDGAQCCKLLF